MWRIVPAALAAILVGVWLSNRFHGPGGAAWLGRLLAVFIAYVVAINIFKLIKPTRSLSGGELGEEPARDDQVIDEAATWPRCGGVGGVMGLTAGLLGIGGGGLAVPLQQVLLELPLKRCIANSAAVICVTAGLGAV